jgi:adenylate cyclase
MGVEIERKFLVDHEKWKQLAKPEGSVIKQGYLAKEPSKTVRVRVKGHEGYITIKGKTEGMSRLEYEYAIPGAEANELLHNFCQAIIQKTRYDIWFAGKRWEVDVFGGNNEGLIIAEIELTSEADVFEYPEWVTQEVTNDKRFYNSNLSVTPYKPEQ